MKFYPGPQIKDPTPGGMPTVLRTPDGQHIGVRHSYEWSYKKDSKGRRIRGSERRGKPTATSIHRLDMASNDPMVRWNTDILVLDGFVPRYEAVRIYLNYLAGLL